MRPLLLLCVLPLSAQWINHPTAGVPRTASGEPNLTAPAPRTADGHPDFTGLWLNMESLPCPPLMLNSDGTCVEMTGLPKQAPNIGYDIQGGLPYSDWSRQVMTRRGAENDPHVFCLPSSGPRLFTLPHYNKFLQAPGMIAILNEFNANYRQIFTDGRALPADPQPAWYGYSSGKWDGDTLVVETIGFRDDLWLDMRGSPLTSAATMTERIRRPNYGTLEIELTIDDRQAYTKPWTIPMRLSIALDTELLDEFCLEAEQSAKHMPKK